MKSTTLAWQFRCDLSLKRMRERLNSSWPSPWMVRDSDYKQDSISGAMTKGSSARVYEYGVDFYIVNLTIQAEEADFDAAVEQAKKRLLDDAFPAVGAREIKPTDPTDGT